jgi:hypothetical protein
MAAARSIEKISVDDADDYVGYYVEDIDDASGYDAAATGDDASGDTAAATSDDDCGR